MLYANEWVLDYYRFVQKMLFHLIKFENPKKHLFVKEMEKKLLSLTFSNLCE